MTWTHGGVVRPPNFGALQLPLEMGAVILGKIVLDAAPQKFRLPIAGARLS
jgi:hypothetical protein